jgi:hypothetical protein
MKTGTTLGKPLVAIGRLLLLAGIFSQGMIACSWQTQPPAREKVPQALIGTWYAQEERDWQGNLILIFLPDGNFITIDSSGKAGKGQYWIKPTTFPMSMDLLKNSPYSLFRGVFQFLDQNTIEFQEKAVGISDSIRPTNFSGVRKIYKRLSNQTDLPKAIQKVENQLPSTELRESLGRDYVISMLFAQRTYFDKHRQFAPRLFQIHPGFYEEDIDYRYQVVVQEQLVWVFGLPKHPGLRSFTGGLVTGEGYSSAIRLCTTAQPSQQPAAMYRLAERLDFQCGHGSHSN